MSENQWRVKMLKCQKYSTSGNSFKHGNVNVVKLWIYELFKSLKNNHKPAEKSVTVTCSSNLGGIIHVKAIKIYSYFYLLLKFCVQFF